MTHNPAYVNPAQNADYERAVEVATDALEVFFNCEEPVTNLDRTWIAAVARKAVEAAAPLLIDGQEGA